MNKIFTIVILFLIIIAGDSIFAADKYAVASGNWNQTATWSLTRGGAPGATVPGAADSVIIPSGFVVNVEASGKNCLGLNVESGGALTASGINPTSSQIYIRVNGYVVQNDGIIGYNPATPTINTPICFESYITLKSVTFKGSGITKISRIRNGNNVSNTTVYIDQDMTFTYTGSTGGGGVAWYGAQGSGANNSFIVKATRTVTLLDNGYIGTNSSVDADGPTTTIQVDGTLLMQGANCTFSLRPLLSSTVSLIINGTVDIGRTLKPTGVSGVSSIITVNSGGELKVGTSGPGVIYFNALAQTVTGAGKFTLGNGGATLYIRSPAGLDPVNGQIKTTGGNSFSTTANYTFLDTGFAQVLGPDFPLTVNNLSVTNGTGLTVDKAIVVNGTFATNTGITTASNLTLNATAQINAGGYFIGSPTYGSSSLLKYNTGGTYGRGSEWNAASGAGAPASVQVSNSTVLNYPNGSNPISFNLTGNLTIDTSSALYMDYGSPGTSNALHVVGNLTLNGNLSLGDAIGGDLYIGGNWTFAPGGLVPGAFFPNNRAVNLNGIAQQTITGATTFPYLFINNAAGVVLANNITISNQLTLQNGILTTGSNTLTLSNGGTLVGEQTNRYVLGNLFTIQTVGIGASTLGDIGVSLTSGFDDIGNVTITRVSGTPVTVISNQGIARKWTISSTSVPSSGRHLSLSWVSDNDNAKDLANAQTFISLNSGSTWSVIGAVQNASVTRTVTITTAQFGDFTVSDASTPLPVELVSFTAKQLDNNIILNWKTATEINNLGWNIEKYSNNAWQKIVFISGSGNSSSSKEYSYIDNKISSGINKYRLGQLDKDGKINILNSVDVNGTLNITSYNITNYPNPFNPSTSIRFEVPEKSFINISVYNALGQKVIDLVNETFEKGIYERNFNASDLSSGIYIYKLNAGKYNISKKMLLVK